MDDKKIQQIDRYIGKVIDDAYKSCMLENHSSWQFVVLDDWVLLYAHLEFQNVESRVKYRLERNFNKNFGLMLSAYLNARTEFFSPPRSIASLGD